MTKKLTNEEAMALFFDDNFPADSESEESDGEVDVQTEGLDLDTNIFDTVFEANLTNMPVSDSETEMQENSLPDTSKPTNNKEMSTEVRTSAQNKESNAERKWKKKDVTSSRLGYDRDTGV